MHQRYSRFSDYQFLVLTWQHAGHDLNSCIFQICISRAWYKPIVTPYIKWGSYNSFAPSPRFVYVTISLCYARVTGAGDVLSVGWNEHGLCGTGDEVNVHTPRPIPTLPASTSVYIACGGGHCFAVYKDKLGQGWTELQDTAVTWCQDVLALILALLFVMENTWTRLSPMSYPSVYIASGLVGDNYSAFILDKLYTSQQLDRLGLPSALVPTKHEGGGHRFTA